MLAKFLPRQGGGGDGPAGGKAAAEAEAAPAPAGAVMASAAAEAAAAGERRTTAAGQAESTLVPTSNPHPQPLQSLMRVLVLQVKHPGIRMENGGGNRNGGGRWLLAEWLSA